MLYRNDGRDKFLFHPPIDIAMNIVDFILNFRTYSKWADAFFQVAQLKKHMFVVYPPTYNVFSRANSVINLTFTFDSTINFELND